LSRLSILAFALVLAACAGGFVDTAIKISEGDYEKEQRELEVERDRLLAERAALERESDRLTREQRGLASRISRERAELHSLRRTLSGLRPTHPARADDISRMQSEAKTELAGPPTYDPAELEDLTQTIARMHALVSDLTR
jgi:hypothetical protein